MFSFYTFFSTYTVNCVTAFRGVREISEKYSGEHLLVDGHEYVSTRNYYVILVWLVIFCLTTT